MARPELSLVIPIYNEEEVLPQLDVRVKALLERLGADTEVVFVNDGSRDKSMELLRRMASHEPRYRVLGFSRNFGHQRAITAGMDKARGRAVVIMDADLQDPPEVILEMVEKWRSGFDVVYGRRKTREGETWFKLVTAKIFYRVFAAMIPIEVPLDTGDFRLMSRRVVMTMRGLRETHRFVRGLVAWVGFKQTAVEYDRAARAAGETKYPLRKMLAFAIDGIASFSILPLRLATYSGVIVGITSVLVAIGAIISKYAGLTVPGWTTTVVLVSFLFSAQFFMIGVLGEYVGRIYEQVKRRPLYVLSERINFGRRKTEKLVTGDVEEVAIPPLPLAASKAALPPPPATVVAAGADAEAALAGAADGPSRSSRLPPAKTPTRPPSVTTGESPAVKPVGTPPSPKVSPNVPPRRTASIPPPLDGRALTSSPPRPRALSIPPPLPDAHTASNAPPPRAPSIPPPPVDGRTTSSATRPRSPSIPPIPDDRRLPTPSAPPARPARTAPSTTAAKAKAKAPEKKDAKALFCSKPNDGDTNDATSKETPSNDGASPETTGTPDAGAATAQAAERSTTEKVTASDEARGDKDGAS